MGFLAMTVEEGDVNPTGFVVVVELDRIGFMEQVGIKNDGTVLSVGDGDGFRPRCLSETHQSYACFYHHYIPRNPTHQELLYPTPLIQPDSGLILASSGVIQKFTFTAAASACMFKPCNALSCLNAQD